jgi:hypothetical protein
MFGSLASPTKAQFATGSWTINSTITRYSAQIAVPAAATTGIEIVFSVGSQTSGTWTIGNVKLEPGSTPTAPEFKPYDKSLAECLRYYLQIPYNELPAFEGPMYTSWCNMALALPVPMRTTPSVNYASITWSFQGGATQGYVGPCGTKFFMLEANGNGTWGLVQATTGNVLFSAEL